MLGASGVILISLFICFMNFFKANRIVPDGTQHSAVSHLGLYYLPSISHKKDARLSRLMRKPTSWFLNRSDTNQAVQAQESRWLEAGNFGFRK